MGVALAVLALGVIALAVAGLWRLSLGALVDASRCPTCRVALEPVAPAAPGHAWELVGCPECRRLETTVHGLPSRLSYCPACHQRALALRVERTPSQVEVLEACQICGHAGRVAVADERPAPREGRVLPFPRQTEAASRKPRL